jgi:hypothetical protein
VKAYDLISGGFWLLISIAVFIESIRLGIGNLHNPGRGFMTYGASGLLGILSLILFIQASIRRDKALREPLLAGKEWERIVFVLIALGLYSVFMPSLGYLISTFVLMTILFWVLEKKKIGWVFVSSILTTLVSYLVFSKWLNCQFPDGLFGF